MVEIEISKLNIGFSWDHSSERKKGFRFLRTVGQGKAPLISDFCHLSWTETCTVEVLQLFGVKKTKLNIFNAISKPQTAANWKLFISVTWRKFISLELDVVRQWI